MAEEKHDELFKDFFKRDKDDEEDNKKEKKSRKTTNEDIQISLVLKKRDIERAAYIAIILFLIIMYFFFPYSGDGFSFSGSNKTVAKVTETVNKTTTAEKNTTATAPPAANKTQPVEQKPLEKSSKDLEMKIERVYSEKKSWGGLITKVVYTITNTKDIIDNAVLKIYVYDVNSEEQWKTREREKVEFPAIGLNAFTRTTPIAGAGVSFTDLTKPKTVKLDLLDADGKLVTTATLSVNI